MFFFIVVVVFVISVLLFCCFVLFRRFDFSVFRYSGILLFRDGVIP